MDQKEQPTFEEKWLQLFGTASLIQLEQFDSKQIFFIDTNEALQQMLMEEEEIGDVIGVDIERTLKIGFDGRICLIQLKFKIKIVILDIITLKNINADFSAMCKLFQNQNIVKVFYSGTQDLAWLRKDFGIQVNSYCDIKNLVQPSEKDSILHLWEKYCNYKFDKQEKVKLQKSDWLQRPLEAAQIQYAALDCFYLPYLRHQLLSKLCTELPYEELSDISKKLEATSKKNQQKELSSQGDFIKIANQNINTILQSFVDSDFQQQKPYYKQLQTSANSKSLICFLFSQIALVRQTFAFVKDLPPHSIETDEQLIGMSVIIFQKLKLDNFEQQQQFFQIQEGYSCQIMEKGIELIKQSINEFDWLKIKQLIGNYLFQALANDEEYRKFALTAVYDVIQNIYNQQNQVKQKKEVSQILIYTSSKKNKNIWNSKKNTASRILYMETAKSFLPLEQFFQIVVKNKLNGTFKRIELDISQLIYLLIGYYSN